jgi:hypothetical protein
LDVVELKPAGAVSIIETDMQVTALLYNQGSSSSSSSVMVQMLMV